MILILEFVNYSIISPVDSVVDPSLNRVSSYVIPPTGHSADKCELVFEVLHINTPAHTKHKHQNPKRHSSCENWKLDREGCQKIFMWKVWSSGPSTPQWPLMRKTNSTHGRLPSKKLYICFCYISLHMPKIGQILITAGHSDQYITLH